MTLQQTRSGAPPFEPATPVAVRPRATDSYRLASAFLFVLSVTIVDVFNLLDRGFATFRPEAQTGGPIRYVVLLVPIGTVIWLRLRNPTFLVRQPTGSDVILLVMFVVGLLGSYIGILVFGTEETARPAFLPMSLGLLALLVVDDPTDREVGRTLRWLSNIGLVYIVMNTLVNLDILPFSEYQQYRNASVAFLALGLGAAAAAGQWRRFVLELAMSVVVFMTYPSATMVLVLLSVGFTLYLTTTRATTLRSIVLAVAVVGFSVLSLANLDAAVRGTEGYFDLVNKANANASRLDLWDAGLVRFHESPIVGTVFAGEAVEERSRDGRPLPFHNDFVLFLALGGVLGIGLLLGWLVLVEVTLLRRIRLFRRAGDGARAALLRAILVGINAFVVAMAFNPVLSGASRSAALFGLYAIAISIGTPGVSVDIVSGREAPSA